MLAARLPQQGKDSWMLTLEQHQDVHYTDKSEVKQRQVSSKSFPSGQMAECNFLN